MGMMNKNYIYCGAIALIITAILILCLERTSYTIEGFTRSLFMAIRERDADRFKQLILPASLSYIESRYPGYAQVLVESRWPSYGIYERSKYEINEIDLNEVYRYAYFGYLEGGDLLQYEIRFEDGSSMRLFVVRKWGRYYYVVDDPVPKYNQSGMSWQGHEPAGKVALGLR